MSTNPIFSFIVPIFNMERHLGKCLESIIRQTNKDWEAILVNDGSKDGSLGICKKYANCDRRFIIIDKEKNEGVSQARLDGLKEAKGEWILFVDSDDWIAPLLLENIHSVTITGHLDIICFSHYKVVGKLGLYKKRVMLPNTGLLSNETIRRYYIESLFGSSLNYPVYLPCKCYNTKVLKRTNLLNEEVKIGEDRMWNMDILLNSKSVYYLDYLGYYYRYGGITSRYYPDYLRDMKKIYLKGRSIAEKEDMESGVPKLCDHLIYNLLIFILSMITHKVGDQEIIQQYIIEELNDPIWEEILNESEHMNHTPFFNAVRNKNYLAIYNICLSEYKMITKRQFAKELLKRL